jgi:hypothetical protein
LNLPLEISRKLKLEPLKRIPEAPEIYKRWRCMTRGVEDDREFLERSKRKLLKEFGDEDVKQVEKYQRKLEALTFHNIQWAEILIALNRGDFAGEGISPIEKVELRGKDRRKHGDAQWALVIGFEYRMDGNEVKHSKLYIPLDPESTKFDALRKVNRKQGEERVLLSGSGERGYPPEWDEVENKAGDF